MNVKEMAGEMSNSNQESSTVVLYYLLSSHLLVESSVAIPLRVVLEVVNLLMTTMRSCLMSIKTHNILQAISVKLSSKVNMDLYSVIIF
jgi:hypothetical protein